MSRLILLLVFGALAFVVVAGTVRGTAQDATLVAGSPVGGTPVSGSIEGLWTFDPPITTHAVGQIVYTRVPPVGGTHNPVWQNCGFYDQPVASEHAVHSLEHGAIWITYHPTLSTEQVAVLRDLVTLSTHILISPFADLPAPVVASSWDHQLRLERADDPRLKQFIAEFIGKAPEPGATCAGGVSETIAPGTPVAASPVAGNAAPES